MKKFTLIILCAVLCACSGKPSDPMTYFKHADQVIWVVKDLDSTINQWNKLGFNQIINLGSANAFMKKSGGMVKIKIAKANLGGANITWIQPVEGESVFTKFHQSYGDGVMSIVHRMEKKKEINKECRRLKKLGVKIKEEFRIATRKGELYYLLADTREKGKYFLGFTTGWDDEQIIKSLSPGNLYDLKLNQYAFAVKDPAPVSAFWHSLGQPEFEISNPEVGNLMYHGQAADYQLTQGWQKEFDIDYEWCIPVKGPIVYDDHIRTHGEGFHHLAYKVKDMDAVLKDYTEKGFSVSMGGTWGEPGKPGSGRYEYIDMENGGGVTVELLWSMN
jgi:hypothetical protein